MVAVWVFSDDDLTPELIRKIIRIQLKRVLLRRVQNEKWHLLYQFLVVFSIKSSGKQLRHYFGCFFVWVLKFGFEFIVVQV